MALLYLEPVIVNQFDTRDDKIEVMASESYFGEVTISMRRKPNAAINKAETAFPDPTDR